MANMSYCRFHNTRLDMNDCINALEMEEKISVEEARNCEMMFRIILEYLECEGIVEEVNWEGFSEWLGEIEERS